MTTYIFPGQGSQFKGMGKGLFAAFPEFIEKANDILGYSIETLCLEDPHQQLTQTQYTQPALYVVNALTYFKKIRNEGKKPNFAAGHSLGEYNALLAADVFDFEAGLKLVKKRGELMSQASGGAMAAILGLNADQIRNVLEQNSHLNVTIANDNAHTQVVISGLKADVEKAQELFEQAGAAMVIPLNVSGAFHSPYMRPAQEQFESFVEEFQFSSPSIPVIANFTARAYDANNISHTLTQQITNPVLWTESISYILEQRETAFEEIGPGNVLTGLVQRIRNGQ
jgi:malonyl CoA-acyl carrier protein transacylase